jgi:CDP-2,3-bis-(O-geranylgeranyl)-sn-glycerol synthase
MITEILQAFWLFLPAGIANMSPVLVKRLPFLDAPIDFGRCINGRRLLGENKTFRGLIFGILAAVIAVWLQKEAFAISFIKEISIINYETTDLARTILLGILFGFGALGGDLVKSFLKRRLDIAPGKQWIPFDQLDWIVGAVILISFTMTLPIKTTIYAIILFGLLHPAINYLGYLMRIKKNMF